MVARMRKDSTGIRQILGFLLYGVFAVLIAACTQRTNDALQGYGEADYVYLSSQDPGIAATLMASTGSLGSMRLSRGAIPHAARAPERPTKGPGDASGIARIQRVARHESPKASA